MTSKKEIDQYFALDEKIKRDIVRVSEAIAETGAFTNGIIPGKLLGLKLDTIQLVPAGDSWDDIHRISDYFTDAEHVLFDAYTPDDDGGYDIWTVPTALLGLSDKALAQKAGELAAAKVKYDRDLEKAEKRRRKRQENEAENANYELYLRLKEQYEPKKPKAKSAR